MSVDVGIYGEETETAHKCGCGHEHTYSHAPLIDEVCFSYNLHVVLREAFAAAGISGVYMGLDGLGMKPMPEVVEVCKQARTFLEGATAPQRKLWGHAYTIEALDGLNLLIKACSDPDARTIRVLG